MSKYLITFVFSNLFLLNLSWAIELEPLKQCGTNTKCLIVDVIEVNIDDSTGPFFNHTLQISTLVDKHSTGMVQKAWKELIYNRGCSDVVDVVVGGTLDEDGAPNSAVPANFATHLSAIGKNKARCTIVVDYSRDSVDHHHDVSVEVGRRALSVVLFKLDSIRTRLGLKQPIRVWGYSKGAAIVESVWTIEAKNARRTLVADAIKNISYDACPSNNCYYMGFGYPYNKQT